MTLKMTRGLFFKLFDYARYAESVLGDCWMNVNTRGSVYFKQVRGSHSDAFDFETSAHSTLTKVIRLVKPTHQDVVYVLGCGKGRAVCHFARRPVAKVVGVELSQDLFREAEGNARRLRGRWAPIQIINGDAANVEMTGGTVYFMFNPFGEETLRAVLKNIEMSLRSEERQITVVYARPLFDAVFSEFSWLTKVLDYRRFSGLRVVIYRNNPTNGPISMRNGLHEARHCVPGTGIDSEDSHKLTQ